MKLAKITLTLATFAFAAATVFVVPMANVKADDVIDQINGTTGPRSFNKNKFKVERSKTTVKVKQARVKNEVVGVGTTGGNVSKWNTDGTDGDVNSGNFRATVTLDNNVNQDEGDGCCCDGEEGSDAVSGTQANRTTGPFSTNINKIQVTDSENCQDIAQAQVKNEVTLVGDTGGNKSIGNTSSGNVDSGDVTFTVGVTNNVN